MKKYVALLLAAILSASLLAACGGSGSQSQQQADEAQAAQTDKAEEDGPAEDAAQAKTDTAADAGAYLVYVRDAETMAPVMGATVQFCSDTLCQTGKTDENGLAAFDADPGTYTVHFMKAPEGYANSTEEFTLDKDTREATILLNKQETGAESKTESGTESAAS